MALPAPQLPLTKKALSLTDQNGFTVIEIIIALTVFLIVLPGLFSVLWNTDIAKIDNIRREEALDMAHSTLDSIKRKDFSDINNYNKNEDVYQTTLTVTWVNLYTKQIVLTMSWQTSSLRLQEVSLTTLITDPANAKVGNTCLISSVGKNPMTILSSVSLGMDNEATGVVIRNNWAYITANATTTSAEDFFVINVTDNASPVIVAKLNTGPGLSSLTVTDNYAFVGNTSINGQLQIIDIRDPAAPALIKTFKLPGNYDDNTTITNAIAYSNAKVYLGTQKSQIAEFHVINVGDISSPKELGSYEINAAVNSLSIIKNTAYIANPSSEEIKIIDVSNPLNLRQAGIFDAPGGSGNGKSLASVDSALILGRTVGGQELYELNVADPLQPTKLSTRDLNTSINSIAATPSWLFLGTTNLAKTIQIWDSTDPTNPNLMKSLILPDKVTSIACGVDKLYATSASVLFIITP